MSFEAGFDELARYDDDPVDLQSDLINATMFGKFDRRLGLRRMSTCLMRKPIDMWNANYRTGPVKRITVRQGNVRIIFTSSGKVLVTGTLDINHVHTTIIRVLDVCYYGIEESFPNFETPGLKFVDIAILLRMPERINIDFLCAKQSSNSHAYEAQPKGRKRFTFQVSCRNLFAAVACDDDGEQDISYYDYYDDEDRFVLKISGKKEKHDNVTVTIGENGLCAISGLTSLREHDIFRRRMHNYLLKFLTGEKVNYKRSQTSRDRPCMHRRHRTVLLNKVRVGDTLFELSEPGRK